MKNKILISFIVLLLLMQSGCEHTVIKTTQKSNVNSRITLVTVQGGEAAYNICYASNVYVLLYNANLPVSPDKSIIIAPKTLPKKYIDAYIRKNNDIKFIIKSDNYDKIKYTDKIIFADDRLPQTNNQAIGGIIETFDTAENAKNNINTLKKEIKSNYIYQNGVDLLALSPLLTKKQAERYKDVFMALDIGNYLDDSDNPENIVIT